MNVMEWPEVSGPAPQAAKLALAVAAAGAVLLALLILECLGFDPGGRMGYRRGRFLSEAEKRFLAVLDEAAGPGFRVFVQVRMAELLDPAARQGPRRQRALNRIFGKSVDFVVCRAVSLEPVAAVELDDRSHLRAGRMARDRLVEEAFASAGLPLVRVPVGRSAFSAGAVREVLFGAIDAAGGSSIEKRRRA